MCFAASSIQSYLISIHVSFANFFLPSIQERIFENKMCAKFTTFPCWPSAVCQRTSSLNYLINLTVNGRWVSNHLDRENILVSFDLWTTAIVWIIRKEFVKSNHGTCYAFGCGNLLLPPAQQRKKSLVIVIFHFSFLSSRFLRSLSFIRNATKDSNAIKIKVNRPGEWKNRRTSSCKITRPVCEDVAVGYLCRLIWSKT